MSPGALAGELGRVLELRLATMSGADLTAVGDGVVHLRVASPPEFERTVGIVHGGAVAALGQLAGAAAMQAVLPKGVRPRRLGVAIDYLRPTPVDDALLVTAEVVHHSRRVIITEVVLATLAGRPTARVTERAVIEEA
jgi:uncharacterized protein (TIGR00369 family)